MLIALSGCRQLLGIDDPVTSFPTDAAADDADAASPEAGADALEPATCMMRWATNPVFGAPVALASLNTSADEDHPFLSPDELTIYFTRGTDVYSATRSNPTAAFGLAVTESSLNSGETEGKVFVSADATRAFFASNRPGGAGGFDLWRAARPGTSGTFSVDQMYVAGVNDPGTQVDPHLSTDLLRLYYVAEISGALRISVGSRNTITQSFGSALPLVAASAEVVNGPTLTQNELVLVYGASGMDPGVLYYATRPALGFAFGNSVLLTSLNTTGAESSPHLSADGCRLYFTSVRSGSRDLVVATML